MAKEFDFLLTNPTATDSQVSLLSPVQLTSQKSTKFRVVTPYAATYPANSIFIFRTADFDYVYQPTFNATPNDIVTYFNDQFDIGEVSLFASNPIDGNVFEIISPYPFTEFEINLSVHAWVAQTASTFPYTSISMINSLEGIITSQPISGTMYETSNGGANWSGYNAGGATTFLALKALPSGIGYACGFSGVLRKTNNIHTHSAWTAQVSGTGQHLRSVFFINDNVGWVCGNNGVIRATLNGGTLWSGQVSGVATILYSVYFIDANNGWICGSNGTILHTINGGTTWNPQVSGTLQVLTSIFFIDANNGWICGWADTILHTTDGGATWNPQVSGTAGVTFNSIFAVDINNIWACGSSEIVINTIDGGLNWTNETLGPGTENLTGIYFTGLTTGWVVGGTVNEALFKYS
jgi:photosystem II stability/assembly factor-like uncharacterized protein